MSDELLPPVGDSEPVVSPEPTITDPTIISKLRDEIKGLKAQVKSAEPVLAKYKELEDAQKSEAQKLAEAVTAAERKAAEKEVALERAVNEAKLTRLMAKAGVDLDVLDLIDISKLDLNDEEGTLKKLNKVAARTTANGASNPARSGVAGDSREQMLDQYFGTGGRSKTTIFGGN